MLHDDKHFMDWAICTSKQSTDDSKQVGCVIVTPDKRIIGSGYNCLIRGCDHSIVERRTRPGKYKWTIHAEINAICDAGKIGHSLNNCTAYISWFPCLPCAGALVHAGIKTFVTEAPNLKNERWGADFIEVVKMFAEVGIENRH